MGLPYPQAGLFQPGNFLKLGYVVGMGRTGGKNLVQFLPQVAEERERFRIKSPTRNQVRKMRGLGSVKRIN